MGKLLKRDCFRPEDAITLKEVQSLGEQVHVGALHALCVGKGSELAKGSQHRKYKGRVVFLGNGVRDQHGLAAMFEQIASSPASLEAGKVVDAYGCLEGNKSECVDAEQAYIQADMKGYLTFVWMPDYLRHAPGSPIPKDDWTTPYLMRMRKALYGHPLAGAFWEEHCATHVIAEDFIRVDDNKEWPSVFLAPYRATDPDGVR